ncbi:hypothetical protein FRC02_008081 [Tulasnella sp. 418]|nr:hypothetical protein FRC02_008081 [Tulasnella sp. 418]
MPMVARFSQLRPSGFVGITSALKKLSTSQLSTEHQALVRHLQYSPDGKYLATGSRGRRAIRWKVGEETSCSQHRTLAHSARNHLLISTQASREKRIVVYNMSNMKSESRVPIVENVRDVTVSADGQHVLVSNEDTAPRSLANSYDTVEVGQWARLALPYTYFSATPVEFAGPSYIGSANYQFIMCAGKNEKIHIWDRESGLLLHSLQASQRREWRRPGIAWNHAFIRLLHVR